MLKFNEWTSQPANLPTPKSYEELEDVVSRYAESERVLQMSDEDRKISITLAATSLGWKLDRRPYYSIYPKVVDSLLKTRLTVPVTDLNFPTNSNALLIRLAKGHELDGLISCIFMARAGTTRKTEGSNSEIILMVCHRLDHNVEIMLLVTKKDKTFEELLAGNTQISIHPDCEQTITQKGWELHTSQATRLALGVALLDHDPDLIVPDILESDKYKLNETIDPETLARLADKAKRRGKFGWVIGECTDEVAGSEKSAHYRRGHWGFRWAGPQKSRLKWTKIKASIIHRDKITHVPTGYLDVEQKEVTQ